MKDLNMKNSEFPFYTAYGSRYACDCVPVGLSLTKQSFQEDCDVNVIVERFLRGGVLPENMPLQFGDVSGSMDFQSAMNMIADGNTAFESIDPAIRAHFDNNQHKLMGFVDSVHEGNPASLHVARSLGMLPPLPEPPIVVSTPPIPPSPVS